MNETMRTGLLGFHYFTDSNHYSKNHLDLWLPVLRSMRVNWLLLQAPSSRAIPEYFIKSLLDEEINPVLQFSQPISKLDAHGDLDLLIATYAKWGVKHLIISDQPNMKTSWSSDSWIKEDLVYQFAYPFMNVANQVINHGMTAYLPPLAPGGDYWDTIFLWETLKLIKTESPDDLKKVGICAAADIYSHELEWGSGGPEHWPSARPYQSSPEVEDQRGFHIHDWYNAISNAAAGFSLDIFLTDIGKPFSNGVHESENPEVAKKLESILRSLTNTGTETDPQLPPHVRAGFIHALSSESEENTSAWFSKEGAPRKVTGTIIKTVKDLQKKQKTGHQTHPLEHYLLLPTYEWGIADWHIDVIKPFIKKYQPTIGFSVQEASLSQKVTVLGGQQVFSDETLDQLRNSGSEVHRIEGDGTELVSNISKQLTH